MGAIMAQPVVTRSFVRDWVGEKSYERARRYHAEGRIVDPKRIGDLLRAHCVGSLPALYRLSVRLAESGISEASCSCPVGSGGHCKHVAALLLTWIESRERFRPEQPLLERLQPMTREDLVHLVEQIVEAHPETEWLVQMALGLRSDEEPDLDAVRRQVREVLTAEIDWEDPYETGRQALLQIRALVHYGTQLIERSAWWSAFQFAQGILEELLEQHEHSHLIGDDYFELLVSFGELLPPTFHHLQGEERKEALRALLELFLRDFEGYESGLAEELELLLIEESGPEERRWLRARLDQYIEAYGSSSGFGRPGLTRIGDLILHLQEEPLDDETFLELCRRTGRDEELIGRLLDLQRFDEAATHAQQLHSFFLVQLTPIFQSRRQESLLAEIILARSRAGPDFRLEEWLKDYAVREQDWETAFRYAQARLFQLSTIAIYIEAKEIAQKVGRWPEVRQSWIERLEREARTAFLIEMHLHEQEIEAALARWHALPSFSDPIRAAGRLDLQISVARGAARQRPGEALALYQDAVESRIAMRGRGNYAEAARLLLEMQSIYEEMGQYEEWMALMQRLLEQNPRLRAMRDEFRQAGL